MTSIDKRYIFASAITRFPLFALLLVPTTMLFVAFSPAGTTMLETGGLTFFVLFVLILPITLSLLLTVLWTYLVYTCFSYNFSTNGFEIEKGVVIKQKILIPYDKIQNVTIYRGPLLRLFGLSKVSIETAGASRTEGVIPGVLEADGVSLRSKLIQLIPRKTTTAL